MTKKELFQLHEETFTKCLDIMKAKNADYTGGADDPFANFRVAQVSLGVPPMLGILMRVQDKMQRLRSFCAKGELEVINESAEDACDDIINYMVLIKGMIRSTAQERAAFATAISSFKDEETEQSDSPAPDEAPKE